MTGRYYHVGGDVVCATGRKISLADADGLFGIWSRNAIVSEQWGAREIARLYARDALSIHLATEAAKAWRRAAGHTDVHAPDRVRARA